MSQAEDVMAKILERKLVAVVRCTAEQVEPTMDALLAGGVDVIEITFTVPKAPDMIAMARDKLGDRIVLGAGTVRTVQEATDAIAAGARFIVAPNTHYDVLAACKQADVPYSPGAFSPTEIQDAWNAGASLVKLFPAGIVGIPYLKAVRAPMPDIPIMPTGGVDVDNAADWLRAGAVALGVGSKLVRKDALAEGRYELITATAETFVAAIAEAQE